MHVRLIEGNLEYAKRFLVEGDVTIINPSEEKYMAAGFKKLIKEPVPEVAIGQGLKPHYEETEDSIIQKWEVINYENMD